MNCTDVFERGTLVASFPSETIMSMLKPSACCGIRMYGGGGLQIFLEVLGGGETEPVTVSLPGKKVVIGKGEGCDVSLPFDGEDGTRFIISEEQDRVFGAAFGGFTSRLNGRKLEEGLKTLLLPGDELEIDGSKVKVRGMSELVSDSAELGRLLAKQELGGSAPISTWPHLLIMNGPMEGSMVPLKGKKGQLVIGRAGSCGLQLNDVDVSRKHAKITWKDSEIAVEDLKSKNGTLVNGARTGGRTPLSDRDDIIVGSTRLTLVVPSLAMDEPTEVAAFEPTRLEDACAETVRGKTSANDLTDWILIGTGLVLAIAALALMVWLLS